jgi:cytochrome c5
MLASDVQEATRMRVGDGVQRIEGFRRAACVLLAALAACGGARTQTKVAGASPVAHAGTQEAGAAGVRVEPYAGRMAYVVVALCDNVHQGIVPVAPALGNGDDAERNLYWGARFGVRAHFNASREWQLVSDTRDPSPKVLERLVYKHRRLDAYLVADAYRGSEIRQATADFLNVASGNVNPAVEVAGHTYGLSRGAASHLVAYVGHDGLMDFQLSYVPKQRDESRRDAVILACISKKYFARALKESGANPLLWTTNLMAPEAYVLKAALEGWLAGEAGEQVRERAAKAYNTYQNCGLKSARGLFATGW